MSQELYYTSAPRGLLPGKSGFCTVAATRQMGAALMERLESLSSYRPMFPPHHPQAALNPLTQSHLRISVGGRSYHLLSRIGSAGLDYTGRTNLFAQHVVLESAELPAGGPAWLLRQDALRLQGGWQGEPRYLEPRTLPQGDGKAGPCREWQRVTGDAGWGGVLAERFEQEPSQVVYLIFEPGSDPLPLLAESLMLLPPERRWEVTFSTYFVGLPPGVPCAWRCVANGSEEATKALRLPGTINLCVPVGPPSGGSRVEQARTGKAPRRPAPVAALRLPPSPMPPPSMPLPEKPAEPARPRSRVLPFLVGLLVGMILTASASGVMGYFFTVQPMLASENQCRELEDKIKGKDTTIAKTNNELVNLKNLLETADKSRVSPEKEPNNQQANNKEATKEEVNKEVRQLLTGRRLLGKTIELKDVQDKSSAEVVQQFLGAVEGMISDACRLAASQRDIRNVVIDELSFTLEARGVKGAKSAASKALEIPSKDSPIVGKIHLICCVGQPAINSLQAVGIVPLLNCFHEQADIDAISGMYDKWYDSKIGTLASTKCLAADTNYTQFMKDPKKETSDDARQKFSYAVSFYQDILASKDAKFSPHYEHAKARIEELNKWLETNAPEWKKKYRDSLKPSKSSR